jgi:hypothetical protein
VPFLEFVVSSASIFTILTISIERYRAVCHPLSVNKNKTKQFIRMVVIIWIVAVLTSIPIHTPRDSRVYFEGFTSNAPFIRWFEKCDR